MCMTVVQNKFETSSRAPGGTGDVIGQDGAHFCSSLVIQGALR